MDRRHLQLSDDFIAEDLRMMELAPQYNKWLFELIRPYLGRRIFEVGAGIGNMTAQFLSHSELVFAIEPNRACLSELKDRIPASRKFEYRGWRVDEVPVESLADRQFDTVVCMNVLEHIEKDDDALRIFRSLLVNKGRLVLLVPAVQAAYGPIDQSVGHFRRYSKQGISDLLSSCNFEIEVAKYSNFIGLLGWFFNAHVGKIHQQNDRQIKMFNRLVPFLSSVERAISPPLGLSLIGVGRKIS